MKTWTTKLTLLTLICAAMLSVSCARETNDDTLDTGNSIINSTVKGNATITITEIHAGDVNGSDTSPYVLVVIKNTGTEVANNLTCTVKAFKESVAVATIDADITQRLPSSTLKADQKTFFEITFSTLQSHSDYDKLDFAFDWSEAYDDTVTHTAQLQELF